MALNIQGNFTTESGIPISGFYCRFEPVLNIEGNILSTRPSFFITREVYETSNRPLDIYPGDMTIDFGYNRESDGVDLLMLAHTLTKSDLESKGYTVEIVDL